MCNSAFMFDLLGEEFGGEHDNKPISLPGNCVLKIWSDNNPNQWRYEAITGCGKKFIGERETRSEAFDAAIDELAAFIN